jgi:F-type H+-transporting ATPase subunit a
MGHHLSWYDFIPGYHELLDFLQKNFFGTVIFNSGVMPKNPVFNTVHHIIAAILVFFTLIIISIISNRKIRNIEDSLIPSKNANLTVLLEVGIETLFNAMKDIIGNDYKRHVPLVSTLALFILFSNLLGLIPGFIPPTDNLNTTFACGIIVFFYFNYHGFRVNGFSHITHLANPIGEWWGWFLAPLLFPVEFFGLLIRPISLSVRLAGNMIGDHKLLLAFAGVMPILVPLPFFLLGLMISIIQTVVFCLLTCVYISLHTQEEAH